MIKTKNLFTAHPQSIGETYLQHANCASKYGLRLVWAGLACLIHSILPFWFVNTASQIVKEVSEEITARRNME